MYCYQCGVQLIDGEPRCSRCGTNMAAVAALADLLPGARLVSLDELPPPPCWVTLHVAIWKPVGAVSTMVTVVFGEKLAWSGANSLGVQVVPTVVLRVSLTGPLEAVPAIWKVTALPVGRGPANLQSEAETVAWFRRPAGPSSRAVWSMDASTEREGPTGTLARRTTSRVPSAAARDRCLCMHWPHHDEGDSGQRRPRILKRAKREQERGQAKS
jgi:hypothetical protein